MEPGVLIVILIVTFVVITLRMLVLWVISLFLADVSIVDIFWGPGLAITAARLAVHLARRNLGRGEDYRYRTMRERHGSRFPLVSLGTVFLLQALLMWIVSWPLQAVHGPQAADSVGWADAGGLVLWIAGLTFEATADLQLARFKRAPESAGQVMDRGLWRYSRHPNYFGDCLAYAVARLAARPLLYVGDEFDHTDLPR